jgi:tetratricopeptide (TPR) repeat protein
MKNFVRLTLRIILFFTVALTIHANQNPSRPDITGGADLIFNRPENPKPRAREEATSKKRTSRDETNDQVDDAIALGNAARDRTPPDFESAEKAYRLAAKLDRLDPRSYVGLGNVFWDQRRFAEAAKAYREALRYLNRKANLVGAMINVGMGISSGAQPKISEAQFRIYFAAALLAEQNAHAAERELRATRFVNSDKPEWHALLGYSLSTQRRYTEAAESFMKAVEREPLNSKYKELLEAAHQNSRQASANDLVVKTQLQNTSWQIQDGLNSRIKGACKLAAKASMECKSVGVPLSYSNARWTIRDGLLEIEKENDRFPLCIGQIRGDTIEIRCYRSDVSDVWMRLSK